MWKILAAVGCLVVVACLVAAGGFGWFYSHWRFRRLSGRTVPTVCISCQGKGWIREQERTLRFEGGGFVDGEVRNHPCPACGGTGVVHR